MWFSAILVNRHYLPVTDSAPTTAFQEALEDLGDLLLEVFPPDAHDWRSLSVYPILGRE
jgi:hypothetical protein